MNKSISKRMLNRAVNWTLVGGVLLLIFLPSAKVWMMQRLMDVGLFRAELKKEATMPDYVASTVFFSLKDSTGRQISSANLKGKVVFLNFWASWCPPCRAEMPSLVALYQQFKNDNGVVFLYVNEDDDPSKMIAYLRANQLLIPVYKRSTNFPQDLFSGTLPTTVVLDKKGQVALHHEGMANYDTEGFRQQLRDLAQEK